jgi:hypothetical protein
VDLAQLGDLVERLGFPVVVALWFMWRVEKRMDAFIAQQAQLLLVLSVLAQAWDVDIPALPDSPKEPE